MIGKLGYEGILRTNQPLRPRPGHVAEVLDVDLPHPRWQYDARATPRFGAEFYARGGAV
jgi:hypothetical protein